MKKSIIILNLLLGFGSSLLSQNITVNINNLSKKWILDKYTFMAFGKKPSEKEKDDYLSLNPDSTYTSISEGIYDSGEWKLNIDNQCILLYNDNQEVLPFIVHKLTHHKLVVYIYDSEDKEAKYLKIHFKN